MIIAHRGESFLAPENTLSSINLAWKKGAMAVEIDIHLTLDNEVVVIHDFDTGRTGDKNLRIKDSTLQQLKDVDIRNNKLLPFSREKIPTLKEVLKTIPPKGKLVIEVKCGEEIIKPLASILQNSGLEIYQIEIIAFDIRTLSLFKSIIPQYKMLWLLDLDYTIPNWLYWSRPNRILKKVIDNNLDGIDAWAGKVLTKNFINVFKEEDLWVYTWTVDDIHIARKLYDYGVDGITTNRAGWLTEQLNTFEK